VVYYFRTVPIELHRPISSLAFLLRHMGHRLPCIAGLAYYLAGFALTTTPAKIGEAVRLWYLRRTIGYAESVPIFIFEQVLDVLAVAFRFWQRRWYCLVWIEKF
jgi:hypothetical protein